jgi:hypothetical protein
MARDIRTRLARVFMTFGGPKENPSHFGLGLQALPDVPTMNMNLIKVLAQKKKKKKEK